MRNKKYNCSKHGNIGDPNCQECRDNLKRLCDDNNAVLINEEGKIQ